MSVPEPVPVVVLPVVVLDLAIDVDLERVTLIVCSDAEVRTGLRLGTGSEAVTAGPSGTVAAAVLQSLPAGNEAVRG